jgi:hypothetical protein
MEVRATIHSLLPGYACFFDPDISVGNFLFRFVEMSYVFVDLSLLKVFAYFNVIENKSSTSFLMKFIIII